MSKVRFSGFPTGSAVTLSALKGGVARGPVAVNAWKQAPASGDPSFKVYSVYGTGTAGRNYTKEVLPGSVIELVNHGGIALYYDDFTGFQTDDPRELLYETDFGERYDGQFMDHPNLPARAVTAMASKRTLGVCRSFVAGHAFRGTDMLGNQVLDKDHQEGAHPPGVTDRTVTCWVSDGVTSHEITFTVRLIDPLRYYTDTTKSTYGLNVHTFGETEHRKGVFVISRNADFNGAPVGEAPGQVYHVTLEDGRFEPGFPSGANLDGIAVDSFTGQPVTDLFGFQPRPTIATLWKRGDTFYPLRTDTLDPDWGTGPSLPRMEAAFDWHGSGTWGAMAAGLLSMEGNGPGHGRMLSNIEIVASEYDVSQEEWRVWWNLIPYTNKTGTISGKNGEYGGDLMTNVGNTANTICVKDVPTSATAGTLWTAQIVADSNGTSGDMAAFADGEVITGPNGSVTVTFDGTERQDRTKKKPPTALKGGRAAGSDGSIGNTVSGCILRGGGTLLDGPGPGFVLADNALLNYWNYGILAFGTLIAVVGTIVTPPGNYEGQFNFGGAGGVSPFNFFHGDEPEENHIVHTAVRYYSIEENCWERCIFCGYGGQDGSHQPVMRLGTSGISAPGIVYSAMTDCFVKGGANCMNFSALGGGTPWEVFLPDDPPAEPGPNRVPFTPKAMLFRDTTFESWFCTAGGTLVNLQYTRWGFINVTMSFPANEATAGGNLVISYVGANDGQVSDTYPPYLVFNRNPDPDPTAANSFVRGGTLIYQGDTVQDAIAPFDTVQRETVVSYENMTLDADASKFPGGISSDYN